MDNETDETPIKIISSNSEGHKTETRIFRRDIHETFCAQPDCEFFGKHASQGHCHTTDVWEDKQFNFYSKQGEEHLASLQDIKKDASIETYIEYLEGDFVCSWIQNLFNLDECIRLRAENAKLKNKLGEYK